MSFDRRDFLRGLGLSAAALGLRPILGGGSVRADDAVPLRIVFWYPASGLLNGFAEPRPLEGRDVATETEWRVANLLEPIADYQDRMIALEGMDVVADRRDPIGGKNAHIAGRTSALTGAFRRDPESAGGPSIDQVIAHHLAADGPITRLPSLEVAIAERESPRLRDGGCYSMSGDPVPFLFDPHTIYDRLFPSSLRDEGSAEEEARRVRRGAVFELLRGQAERLKGRLGTEQRAKVEEHMDARADLERRLGLGGSRRANVPGPEILAPWGEVATDRDRTPEEKGERWWTSAELSGKLVASALHADATRVVTIRVGSAPDALFGYTPGQYGSDNTHDLVHKVSGDSPDLTDPDPVEAIRQWHLREVEACRLLLDELAARTEPDGRSLLDHTVVVYCGQLANGSHDLTRLPWTVIGDAQGRFRTGRLLTLDRHMTRDLWGLSTGDVVPRERWGKYHQEGRAQNDLFLTLAHAMGVELDSVGEPELCTGVIEEMLA
ncbi:MAG TPA: DUF1552 domain-containing protein [Sandaracinaceae bacterium LLY-WYZ-13_1]|nr:DUF1552 domain-containing protein [Sandaracinaceae bacterium LLY-WYZ-13_1]